MRSCRRSAWPCCLAPPPSYFYYYFYYYYYYYYYYFTSLQARSLLYITQSAFITLRMGPSGPSMDGFLTRPGFTGPRARDPARHSLSGPARNHLPGHVPSIRVTHRAHDMTRHA